MDVIYLVFINRIKSPATTVGFFNTFKNEHMMADKKDLEMLADSLGVETYQITHRKSRVSKGIMAKKGEVWLEILHKGVLVKAMEVPTSINDDQVWALVQLTRNEIKNGNTKTSHVEGEKADEGQEVSS